MGRTACTVPVQRCTLPLPIPLLPLRTVRPVQSLSACTTVHFTFTYTSTPPTDRTACTEPQCLYNGELYLFFFKFHTRIKPKDKYIVMHILIFMFLSSNKQEDEIFWTDR